MACFIMNGAIMGGEKYGGISAKPPIFPGHNFTCDFCFANFFLNFKRIYSFLSIPDAFATVYIFWIFCTGVFLLKYCLLRGGGGGGGGGITLNT